MSQVLFVTLGTRDVLVDKAVLLQHFNPLVIENLYRKDKDREFPVPRQLGQFLHQNFSRIKLEIQTPILDAFFALMKRQKQVFEKVILVATDQSEDVDERYRSNDSIEFAQLLVKHLPQKFKTIVADKIEIYPIKQNVAYLDVMFTHFAEALSSPKFAYLKDVEAIHVLNQGGIDAINYALMLNTLYEFGEKVKLYTVNEKDEICLPLQFPQQFGTEQEKKRVRQAISRYDYSMIKHCTLGSDLRSLAAYAEARLNFDFGAAEQELNKLSPALRSIQVQAIKDLKEANSDQGLIKEVFWNAEIRLFQEAYVDFVQRFFRIIEHLAKTACLDFLGFEDNYRQWKNNLQIFLAKPENTALKDHLDGFTFNGSKLNYNKEGNIEIYMAILAFIAQLSADIDPPQTLFSYLQKIKPLKTMRNQGIGAHGFAPISLRTILSALELNEKEDVHKLMNELKAFLQLGGGGPFAKVNTNLLNLL